MPGPPRTNDEVGALINESQSPQQEVAFLFGAQAGLRREETVSVTASDFTHAPDGFLRVWNDYAKRGKYRETLIPEEVASSVGRPASIATQMNRLSIRTRSIAG